MHRQHLLCTESMIAPCTAMCIAACEYKIALLPLLPPQPKRKMQKRAAAAAKTSARTNINMVDILGLETALRAATAIIKIVFVFTLAV